MAEFFSDNIGTILVLIILAVVMALVIRSMIRNKKKGRTCGGCSCSCGGCPHKSSGGCDSYTSNK